MTLKVQVASLGASMSQNLTGNERRSCKSGHFVLGMVEIIGVSSNVVIQFISEFSQEKWVDDSPPSFTELGFWPTGFLLVCSTALNPGEFMVPFFQLRCSLRTFWICSTVCSYRLLESECTLVQPARHWYCLPTCKKPIWKHRKAHGFLNTVGKDKPLPIN